jgi:RNA polymerase sigma-70 factor (ECF subfamily)
VEEHEDFLFRFALIRLRAPQRAEDAVQETFLAALKGGRNFAGRSGEKRWLAGIWKNKIIDYFRKASRETSFTDLQFYSDEELMEWKLRQRRIGQNSRAEYPRLDWLRDSRA